MSRDLLRGDRARRRLQFENLERRELMSLDPAWQLPILASNSGGASSVAVSTVQVASTQEPKGYYILQSAEDPANVPATTLTDPDVVGVVLRRQWADVNPSPGAFDWSYFDREINRAASNGKKVQLSVLSGTSAPNWIYNAGARAMFFTDDRYPDERFKMPVPWDPVMLAKWDLLVRAMGARYDRNSNVTLVHMAGPTRFSPELVLPMEVTKLWDYTPARVVSAWDQAMASFDTAFVNTALSLNVSLVTTGTDNCFKTITAHAVSLLGDRATLQHNALSAKTTDDYQVHALVENYGEKGTRVGYEMLSTSTEKRFGGSLYTAINVGRRSGAQFEIIYPADRTRLTGPF